MEPASTIVKRLGGPKIVAKVLGVSYTVPYKWQYSKAGQGTGGTIPLRYIRTLLDYARDQNIELYAEDFIP
jgi:hypothetical protein